MLSPDRLKTDVDVLLAVTFEVLLSLYDTALVMSGSGLGLRWPSGAWEWSYRYGRVVQDGIAVEIFSILLVVGSATGLRNSSPKILGEDAVLHDELDVDSTDSN